MKKLAGFLTFLLCLSLFQLAALNGDEFNSSVDFPVTLEDLCNFVESQPEEVIQAVIAQDRIFLIIGVVDARKIVPTEGDEFLGEIEAITGQWQGLEEVKMFRCITQYRGDQFARMIPARRSRTADPNEIPLNVTVLQAVKLIGTRDYMGQRIPLLEGLNIRIIR